MGRVKRQQKKWRQIDSQEVDDFLEKTTREERQGLVIDTLPNDDLFFVDTVCGPNSGYMLCMTMHVLISSLSFFFFFGSVLMAVSCMVSLLGEGLASV